MLPQPGLLRPGQNPLLTFCGILDSVIPGSLTIVQRQPTPDSCPERYLACARSTKEISQ